MSFMKYPKDSGIDNSEVDQFNKMCRENHFLQVSTKGDFEEIMLYFLQNKNINILAHDIYYDGSTSLNVEEIKNIIKKYFFNSNEDMNLKEALRGKEEIDEFFKLCDELGLRTLGDLERFADDNRNRIIVNNLLKKYDSSMSSDAFFQTLKDYKQEEFGGKFKAIPDDQNPEFKYDDPMNVVKRRKTESYVDKTHTYYAVLSEKDPELIGMIVPIIAWDSDNDEYFDFFYADAPGLVDGVDKLESVEDAKERAKEIMEANWQTFGENEWPVLYIGKFNNEDELVEFVDEVREFAKN